MAPATAIGKRLSDALSRDERAAKRAARHDVAGPEDNIEDNIAVVEDDVVTSEDKIEDNITVVQDDVVSVKDNIEDNIAVVQDDVVVSKDKVVVSEDNVTVPEHSIAVDASDLIEVPKMPISATSISGDGISWALNRQDLCEASPYFKSYQSGLYSRNRVAHGIYMGQFVEPRDFLYHNELVVNVGGSRVRQAGEGDQPMIRTDKTPPDLATWKNSIGMPVVVIIGSDHPQFNDLDFGRFVPRKVAKFVELGTFIVIGIWGEMVHPDRVHVPYPVFKVGLHTIRTDLLPYYKFLSGHPVDIGDDDTEIAQSPTASKDAMVPQDIQQHGQKIKCPCCGEMGLKAYANVSSFVCLRMECQMFWHTEDGKLLGQFGDDGKPLRYSGTFLKSIGTLYGKKKDLPEEIPQIFQPLRPSIDMDGEKNFGTELKLRSGFTCPRCHCCNSKRFWDRLQCRYCGFTKDAVPLPYPMKNIKEETMRFQHKGKPVDGVTVKIDESQVKKFTEVATNGSLLFVYMLTQPDGKLMGTLVVERPSEELKKAQCGADELLRKIQEEGSKMKFQRNPARHQDGPHMVLGRHYQSNWGVPYDFGQTLIPSPPFEEAPDVVLMSLAYLTDTGKRALERSQSLAREGGYSLVDGSTLMKPYKPYNELLALAYRETDAISFHDDGEDQVDGVISTASLGSPATMKIGMKPPPGSKKQPYVIAEVQLCHGDVATMCDTNLQALAVHQVKAEGVRRYAATGRTIDLNYYSDEKKAGKLNMSLEEIEASGKLPARARNFSYGVTTLGV
ncbi:hypothetical protein SLS53_006590 [Cytospora paraplurivora]|uniref:Alpha-ketoglutarate-dependent dioxygenase AlkB-like domain-containing protein n=1 Tax=Cytospora paraplurivora TaxID=2898453 RepID=A0AAN9U2Z2_9PEZI